MSGPGSRGARALRDGFCRGGAVRDGFFRAGLAAMPPVSQRRRTPSRASAAGAGRGWYRMAVSTVAGRAGGRFKQSVGPCVRGGHGREQATLARRTRLWGDLRPRFGATVRLGAPGSAHAASRTVLPRCALFPASAATPAGTRVASPECTCHRGNPGWGITCRRKARSDSILRGKPRPSITCLGTHPAPGGRGDPASGWAPSFGVGWAASGRPDAGLPGVTLGDRGDAVRAEIVACSAAWPSGRTVRLTLIAPHPAASPDRCDPASGWASSFGVGWAASGRPDAGLPGVTLDARTDDPGPTNQPTRRHRDDPGPKATDH